MKHLKRILESYSRNELSSIINDYNEASVNYKNKLLSLRPLIFEWMDSNNIIEEYGLEVESEKDFLITDILVFNKKKEFQFLIDDFSGEDPFPLEISFENYDFLTEKGKYNL